MIEEVIRKESVFRTIYPGDTEIINKHIKHILEYDKGRIKSNKGGYQSNDITFGFEELIAFIKQSLIDINIKAVFSNFWLNINNGNDYNLAHIHELDHVSIVYYHKVCCENTPIVFSDMVPHIRHWTYNIVPKQGELLMFDADMPHSVSACGNPNHQRISIAFNFRKL